MVISLPLFGPQGQCCVSERVGPESLDTLEAFQKGLVHLEGHSTGQLRGQGRGCVFLPMLSSKVQSAWEMPGATPWGRRRRRYSVLGNGGRMAARVTTEESSRNGHCELWHVCGLPAPSGLSGCGPSTHHSWGDH